MKKIFAFLMTCVMIFTMIPVSVFADEAIVPQEIEIAPDSETVEDITIEVIEPEVLVTEVETETEVEVETEEVEETTETDEITEPEVTVETEETTKETVVDPSWTNENSALNASNPGGALEEYVVSDKAPVLNDVGDNKYDETEPNNSRDTAKRAYHDYTVAGTTTLNGYDTDFFAFTLSSSTYVELIAGCTKPSLAFNVYKSTSESAIGSTVCDTANGSSYIGGLTGTLSAGTYYVCVFDTQNVANTYILYFDLDGSDSTTDPTPAPTATPEPTPTPTPIPEVNPTPPENPTLDTPAVAANYDPTNFKINVTWAPVAGASYYYITYADYATGAVVADYPVTNSFEVTNLKANTEYTFYVQAWGTAGCSDFGVATARVGLAAPVVTASNNPDGHVLLTWNAVEGASMYTVMRAPSGTNNYTAVKVTTELSYADDTTALGVAYDYYVKPIGTTPDVTDPCSNVVTGYARYAAPSGITATNVASTGKIKLSWNAVPGAVSYKVFRSTKENGTYSLMKNVTDGTTYTNESAKPGVTYFFKIMTVVSNSNLSSAMSAAYQHTCDLAQPVITMGNDAKTGKVTITWKKVDSAVKYQVYRATSKTGTYKLQKTVTGTTYTNTSAVAGTTYYYKVRAVASNTDGNSAFSAIKSRLCDLARPTIKVASSSTSSIKISWAKVTNAAKYQVYRATSKTGNYKLLKTTTALNYTNSGLTAGKTYYYKVKAIHTNTSANSADSEILTAKATVMAPTLKKTASVTSSAIKISWNKVTGASGYYVYRRTSTTGTWKKVKTITSGSTTEFNNTGLSSGSYYYCVEAYKTVSGTKHASIKSDAIRCRTLAKPTLNYSRTRDDENNGGYQLTWNKRTGATAYELQCKVADGSWKKVHTTSSGSETSIWLPTSKYGYTHYFRVRAIYKSNGVTSYGAYSSSIDAGYWYWNPSYSVWMSSESYSNQIGTIIQVTNKGDYTLRFYSSGGRWIDADYTSFDRNCALYDYDQYFDNGKKVKLTYVDIKPGETKNLLVLVQGDPTWYDKYTTIKLKARYNNQYFITKFSKYYGMTYSHDGIVS